MTKEEIIEMAKQAGLPVYHAKFDTRIKAFAKLVAEKERGFVDDMLKQAQSSVDKAVNSMSQRTWVRLTEDEAFGKRRDYFETYKAIEAKYKEENIKHEKTFNAISKLKDIEMELHRLKNALEMANRALDAQPTQVMLTDAEISESYYEVFKTAMIDIKAFEFAYSLLRKAQKK